jgi:hypothetical protein
MSCCGMVRLLNCCRLMMSRGRMGCGLMMQRLRRMMDHGVGDDWCRSGRGMNHRMPGKSRGPRYTGVTGDAVPWSEGGRIGRTLASGVPMCRMRGQGAAAIRHLCGQVMVGG